MPLIGLLVALVAALALAARFLPMGSGPEAPAGMPAQTLERAREAAAQMEALQKRRLEQVERVDGPH